MDAEKTNSLFDRITGRIGRFIEKYPQTTASVADTFLVLIGVIEMKRSLGEDFGPNRCLGLINDMKKSLLISEIENSPVDFVGLNGAAVLIHEAFDHEETKNKIKEYLKSLQPKPGSLEKFLCAELKLQALDDLPWSIPFFMSHRRQTSQEDFILPGPIETKKLDKAIREYYHSLGGSVKFASEDKSGELFITAYFEAEVGQERFFATVTNGSPSLMVTLQKL